MKKSESAIQQECVEWFNNKFCLKHYIERSIIFHVANENQHKLMNLGVLSGVSDLIVIHKGEVIFIEMKDETGKQSPKQIEFQERVEAQGLKYHLIRDKENFISLFE